MHRDAAGAQARRPSRRAGGPGVHRSAGRLGAGRADAQRDGGSHRALDLHRPAPPTVEHVRALQERDTLLDALGRYDEAREAATLALQMCEGLDAPTFHRSLLIQQSFHDIDTPTGDLERALARLDEAAALELGGPDPEGDIYLAVTRTEILRTAGRVGDQVTDAGRPGLEAAATWGLETFPALIVRSNMSSGLRLAGRVRHAASECFGTAAPEHVEAGPLLLDRDVLVGGLVSYGHRVDELVGWTP